MYYLQVFCILFLVHLMAYWCSHWAIYVLCNFFIYFLIFGRFGPPYVTCSICNVDIALCLHCNFDNVLIKSDLYSA